MRERVVAVVCADIHLSLRPPSIRKSEKDWLVAQARPLAEIKMLARTRKVPIICAGDIFHRWNPPVELVNWARAHLPIMYAIPGNHDLPNHRYDLQHKCAFESLVWMGIIIPLLDVPIDVEGCRIVGNELGAAIPPASDPNDILVVHQFLWTKKTGYTGAPKSGLVSQKKNPFQGYLAVVAGDNHQPFTLKSGKTVIVNCGTLIRRTAKDLEMHPTAWLLYNTGTIHGIRLESTQKDSPYGEVSTKNKTSTASNLLDEIADMRKDQLDYRSQVMQASCNEPEHVRRILEEVME